MKVISILASAFLAQSTGVNAYTTQQQPSNRRDVAQRMASQEDDSAETTMMSRRGLLRTTAALSAGALLGDAVSPRSAVAADDDVAVPLYFGVGVST